MATLNGKTNRQSYFLSVKPVDFSLTEGTNIPPPPDSPTKDSYPEPPTPGGGPLTSHPATPPGERATQDDKVPETKRDRTDSFRTPTSPASAVQHSSSPATQNKPSGVRRLFSLNNLRSSFSSSRTSLGVGGRQSHDSPQQKKLQQMPQMQQMQQMQQTPQTQQTQLDQNSTRPPPSPSLASTTAASSTRPGSRPELRQQKSGNWFKRKSGMFLISGGELEAVDENHRPDTRESKRLKESSPAPLLPELGSLGGGDFKQGDMGWDEKAFKR